MADSRRFSDNPEFDPYKRFIESVPDMLEDARAVVRDPNKSYSYRDVRVGCAAFVIDLEENSITKPARGNVKRGVKEKICAEKKILGVVKKQEVLYSESCSCLTRISMESKKLPKFVHQRFIRASLVNMTFMIRTLFLMTCSFCQQV